jgi:hypothetical protein
MNGQLYGINTGLAAAEGVTVFRRSDVLTDNGRLDLGQLIVDSNLHEVDFYVVVVDAGDIV